MKIINCNKYILLYIFLYQQNNYIYKYVLERETLLKEKEKGNLVIIKIMKKK